MHEEKWQYCFTWAADPGSLNTLHVVTRMSHDTKQMHSQNPRKLHLENVRSTLAICERY